jgi:hypothetical protein
VLVVRTSTQSVLNDGASERWAAGYEPTRSVGQIASDAIAAIVIGAAGVFVSTELDLLAALTFIEWFGSR